MDRKSIDTLRDFTSELHSTICDNDIMNLKLRCIKEALEEENNHIEKLATKDNDYNLGMYDEFYLLKSQILKIIE